jgi:hypothetical protein
MAKFLVRQYRNAVVVYYKEVEAENARAAWENTDPAEADWKILQVEDQDEAVLTVHDFNTSQEIIDANGAEIEQPPAPS